MKHNTILDLSERTGYSISTISRVLSGKSKQYRISEKTVALIESEARAMGYTPSFMAKCLRTQRTHTLGLIVPCIDNPYFATIASVVASEAKRLGYSVIIIDSKDNEADEQDGIRLLLARRVDGMIVVPCSDDATMLEMVSETTPVVLIDRYYENTKLSYVCSDNYNGSIDAVKYLTQFGHRKILCIRGNLQTTPVKDRVRGYMDAMLSASFEDSINVSGNSFSVETGYLETKLALSSRDNRPTAVFALSNTILLGALKAIKEADLRIPDDISLVSFDGSKYFDYLDPAITHVSQPINNMGLLAIKILVQEIDGTNGPGTHIELPVQLIVKDSVGMIRRPALLREEA